MLHFIYSFTQAAFMEHLVYILQMLTGGGKTARHQVDTVPAFMDVLIQNEYLKNLGTSIILLRELHQVSLFSDKVI